MSKFFKFQNNRISDDFPLPRCQYEEIDFPSKKPLTRKILNMQNLFNNEVPDVFILNTIKENESGYNNPFLSEVIKFDRSEQFKKINSTRDQVKLIDHIKSKRK